MNMRSANMAYTEALWREYIEADPDLRRLERRKRNIAHRRIREEHAKQVRREAGREIIRELINAAMRVALFIEIVVVFMMIVCLA